MLLGKGKRQHIITGLDIGTTKVCAIIAQADAEGKLTILGWGSHPSKGLRCGEITELRPTIDAIVRATSQAMEVANVAITDLYVGIAGDHIRSQNSRAMIEVRSPMRGIDHKDRRRAVAKAKQVHVPDDQALIHAVVQEFRVNGGQATADPIGLSGSNLEVYAHLVMSSINALKNIERCVERAGFRRPLVVLQSLASSMSVATPQELELGSVLIDIGGGTTDIAVSIDGAIRFTAEIPFGGDLITRDIAKVLGCSLSAAENIKKRYGSALPDLVEQGRTFEAPITGEYHRIGVHEECKLARIVEATLEDDIFGPTRRLVEQSGYAGNLPAGAILTGGTSLLTGITDVAERILDMRTRCGAPKGIKGFAPVVSSPIYSTAVGLVLYGLGVDQHATYRRARGTRRLIESFIEYFI